MDWFEITMPAIVLVFGIGTIWKREIPVELDNGPETFRIKGIYADILGSLMVVGGIFFLLMAV